MAKAIVKDLKKEPLSSDTKKQGDYIEIALPKLSLGKIYNRLHAVGLTPFLVLLLIIFAYLLGSLTTKVEFLEKQAGSQTAVQTTGQNTQAAPSPIVNVDVDPGKLPVFGNNSAQVTIIEFSDFECPFCKRFYDDTLPQLKEKYVDTGKVKMTYRHLPLSIHAHAQKSAEASNCANEQGKFWEYHDLLFETQEEWAGTPTDEALEKFVTHAGALGLDQEKFRSCLTSDSQKAAVEADAAAGVNAGASATPTFFINGKMLVGAQPFSAFAAIIDEELQ